MILSSKYRFIRLWVCIIGQRWFWRSCVIVLWVSVSAKFVCVPGCPTCDMTWYFLTNESMLCYTVNSTKKRWYGLSRLQRLWRPLPVGVGLVLLGVLQWRHRQKERSTDSKTVVVAKDWEVSKFNFV